MNMHEQSKKEVEMYLTYCQMAALHNAYEQYYRSLAHRIFYHIQELRSTKPTDIQDN